MVKYRVLAFETKTDEKDNKTNACYDNVTLLSLQNYTIVFFFFKRNQHIGVYSSWFRYLYSISNQQKKSAGIPMYHARQTYLCALLGILQSQI